MADSVSTEAWLDQRRWAALEEALKAQGSNVKRHLQDYLIRLELAISCAKVPVKYEADEIKRRQKEEKTQRETEPVMA